MLSKDPSGAFMRASQAIGILQELIAEHGDLDLTVFDYGENEYLGCKSIEFSEYRKWENKLFQVFEILPKDD